MFGIILNTFDSHPNIHELVLSYRIPLADQPVNMKEFDVMELEIDEFDNDIVSRFVTLSCFNKVIIFLSLWIFNKMTPASSYGKNHNNILNHTPKPAVLSDY